MCAGLFGGRHIFLGCKAQRTTHQDAHVAAALPGARAGLPKSTGLDSVSSRLLCPVHGPVRTPQRRRQAHVFILYLGNAHGNGHRHLVALDLELCPLDQQALLFSHLESLGQIGFGQNKHELLAPEPGQKIRLPQPEAQFPGNLPEAIVPHLVAEGVVDLLEIVHIH